MAWHQTGDKQLTHWGRVTHICVCKINIIVSDNGLSPERRQAIIWTNAGILLIGPLGTNFSDIFTGIQTFSFKKMHLKMSSGKWRPFCLSPNVLIHWPLGDVSVTLKVIFKCMTCRIVDWAVAKELLSGVCHITSLMVSQQLHWFQVMAWCRQATSHYLSQWWTRYLSPYGITRPEWVKDDPVRWCIYIYMYIYTHTHTYIHIYIHVIKLPWIKHGWYNHTVQKSYIKVMYSQNFVSQTYGIIWRM